jgi:hypothetical protein
MVKRISQPTTRFVRASLCLLLIPVSIFVSGSTQKRTPGPKEVYGRIQFVNALPDVKVQVVTALPDLRVKRVKALANKPGEWQIVDSLPDYKVQLVDALPDFTIQWVDSLPGGFGSR